MFGSGVRVEGFTAQRHLMGSVSFSVEIGVKPTCHCEERQ
jgi:hypothetical protein